MASENKVLCFIPMRNCQSKIGSLLKKFQGPLLQQINEILVVDNASTDASLEEARKALSEITGVKVSLIQNSRNFGLGGSHKIAFNYARENKYDYLFVVHGDNSADPNAFLPVLSSSLRGDEAVLSDRLHGNFPRKGYPLQRLLFNRILSLIASAMTGSRIADFGGGPLNVYRVSSFLNAFENPIKNFSNQIEFSQHALTYAVYRRMKFRFVPVDFEESGAKSPAKLFSQFLKPVLFLLRYRLRPRKTIAPQLTGSFFGHTYLKVKVDPAAPITPPAPKPRKEEPGKLMDLQKTEKLEVSQDYPLAEAPGMEVVWIRMKLRPWHLTGNILEAQINSLLKFVAPERLILDIQGDEVVKNKQCYDFLTFCLDRGIEPQLITNAVGDINLWRNYAKLVKNLTINYIPGEVQRSFFSELIREVAPMGNISVNILTHRDFFYHSIGLKKKIESEVTCRSLLLQPYFLSEDEQLPEDHLQILLDQTAVVHTWFKSDVFRKHVVYTLGQALKDSEKYSQALKMGFMDMSPRRIPKDKIKTMILEEDQQSGRLFI